MKKHALWLALAVAAFLIAAGYLMRRKPVVSAPASPPTATSVPLPSKSPFAPPPNQAAPAKPQAVVAIEDGKTIDFSSGAPVVKDTAAEKALIEKAVKQMEDAMRDVTFSSPPQAAPPKEAEPAKK